MAIVRLNGAPPSLGNFAPLPRFMSGAAFQLAEGEIPATPPPPRPSSWGPAQTYRTTRGAEVSDRVVNFKSQADQIRFLRDLIDEYRGHPTIRDLARHIVFGVFAATSRFEVEYAIAIGNWVQQNIRYVRELPEVFQTPTETLRGFGDCDDHAVLVGALLESLGIKAELVAMEWDTPDGGRAFMHIWTRARVTGSDGRTVRVPLDTTLSTSAIDELVDPAELARQRGYRVRLLVL